jgi:hypothetical protein
MRVNLLLMRDLEWLALILAVTILSFLLLAATQRPRGHELEEESER